MRDQRKEPRTKTDVPVWMIGPSNTPLPCTLSNMSMRGAELLISPYMVLPDSFALWLTEDGKVRRDCKLVWRKGHQVGIEFFKFTDTPSASVR